MDLSSLWFLFVMFTTPCICFDPSISNGTCYFAAKRKAAGNFIPCGNSAGGIQSCCQARDICLSSNACFNGQFGVTYIVGCTDETYVSKKCPYKADFNNQQWVGLVRCRVSSGIGEQWGPCEEPPQPQLNKGNTNCSCDASQDTAVFTDAATLTNIASLPVVSGNAIAWFPGFTPSTTILDSSTLPKSVVSLPSSSTGISSPPPSTTASASVTSTATAGPTTLSSRASLSTATKAGIGVACAIGVIFVLTLLAHITIQRRRRIKKIPPVMDQIRPSSINTFVGDANQIQPREDYILGTATIGQRISELPTEANEVNATQATLEHNSHGSSTAPASMYQNYRHSLSIRPSEMEASPSDSTSALTHDKPAYVKPTYMATAYEMPG